MLVWVFLWSVSAGVLLGTALTMYRLLTSVSLALAAIDAPDL
jgi:hypothetical protein